MNNLLSNSPLVWFAVIGLLCSIPILIHLLNRWRFRRVRWPAMALLLASYRRRRNWVRLRQAVLLLSRIAVLLIALLMLANVGCQNLNLTRWLDDGNRHLYVVIDDSYSMSQIDGETVIFQRAKSVLENLVDAYAELGGYRMTVLPMSRAVAGTDFQDSSTGTGLAAISDQSVDSQFLQRNRQVIDRLEPTSWSLAPTAAFSAVTEWIARQATSGSSVYVISDFRALQWESEPQVKAALEKLGSQASDIHFLRCVETSPENVSIVELQPASNLRVAGFPTPMQLAVKNHGQTTVEYLVVQLQSIASAAATISTVQPPAVQQLPSIVIPSIPPGKTVQQKFNVFFREAGDQIIQATIARDALTVDNQRHCVVEFREQASILIVDDANQSEAFYLSNALSPKGLTGIAARVEGKAFLRDATPESLRIFEMIAVLDVGALDDVAVAHLEQYVRNGGGLLLTCGPQLDREQFDQQLWKTGSGLSPIPLVRQVKLPPANADIPDVTMLPHVVSRPFIDGSQTLLSRVLLDTVLAPPTDWIGGASADVEIIAHCRDDESLPLLVGKSLDSGRVALLTTSIAPMWNTWALDGSFPLMLLMLEDWLAAGNQSERNILIGGGLEWTVAAADYRSSAEIYQSTDDGQFISIARRELAADPQDSGRLQLSIPPGFVELAASSISNPGVLQIKLEGRAGNVELRRYAIQLDGIDSDLRVASTELLKSLGTPDKKAKVLSWTSLGTIGGDHGIAGFAKTMFVMLVGLMLLEPLLGYWNSYQLVGRQTHR